MAVPDQIAIELKRYDVEVVFGIVGIPVVDLAESLVKHGIRFISCRNEQSCSYAASAYGYLMGKPGVILVVGGPGVIHALAGVYNSYMNKWPLILLAGSTEDEYYGGFQELDQLTVLSQWSAFSARITPSNIAHLIYTATKTAMLQRTVTYIDIPGRLMNEEATTDANTTFSTLSIEKLRCGPDPEKVGSAATLLQSGQRVLVIVGRGCIDYSLQLREFVEKYALPFLPTPMAKGVIPDSHELNVNSARSWALKTAEIVLVLGARLNWMLHFGAPPKWNHNAIFIQVDHDSSSLGQNNPRGVQYCIHSDVGLFISSLCSALPSSWSFGGVSEDLIDKVRSNVAKLRTKEQLTPGTPLNYHSVYAEMRKFIDDRSTILAIEGANTMDIARVCFPTDFPRHRLDAGTNATMGVGIGYAMAAKIVEPAKYVVAIQGDSAFGFSCMELETLTRNKLGIVVVVMNNGGIYHGNDGEHQVRTTDLTPECRYDVVGQGLGCDGAIVYTLEQLRQEFPKALARSQQGITTILNVIIEPGTQSKLSFGWQSKSKM